MINKSYIMMYKLVQANKQALFTTYEVILHRGAFMTSEMDYIHESLLYAGYKPRAMVSDLMHDAITRAFELLGESCSSLFLNHLSTIRRLPRHIVLTRYDLISKAISQTFGYGSEVFMHEIRANLLRNLPHLDNSLSTAEIIYLAHKAEALRFVRNLRSGYAVLIHSSYGSRDEVLGSFFQPTNTGWPADTEASRFGAIKYDNYGNITAGGRTYCNLVFCRHPSSLSLSKDRAPSRARTRASGDGRSRAFLCTYSTDQASKDFTNTALVHDHVITDQPFIVYSRP
nr:hypothetical protein [uncultured Nitrososphaera sp.]